MPAKNNRSLQDQLAELNELLEWFDQDDFDLEQAIDKYKQAEKVAGDIRVRLNELQNEITVLKESFDKPA